MHDGQNLFNASTSAFGTAWMCQDTVNSLVTNGQMREIIIVGVDNGGANRTYELTYSIDPTVGTGGGLDLYLDFVEQTVMPLMMDRYRIDASASASTGKSMPTGGTPSAVTTPSEASASAPLNNRWDILGSSLGGLASCYALYTRPSIYGFAGCMSSSFWWNSEDFNNTVIPDHAVPLGAIYVDSGNAGPDDDDVVQTQTVRDHLESIGFPLQATADRSLGARSLGYYLQQGGQHSEYYWGQRFYVPMLFAYQPSVDAAVVVQ